MGLPHPTLGDEITAVLACNRSQQVLHRCGATEVRWLPECIVATSRQMLSGALSLLAHKGTLQDDACAC